MPSWISPQITNSVILLPLLIFVARAIDVSMGTMRVILTARGRKFLAPLIGFVEMLIWALAFAQVIQNLNNIFCYIAFAAGFAAGNFVGILIEEKLALGFVVVRVISPADATRLVEFLKLTNYGVTTIEAKGKRGKVNVIFMVVPRGDVGEILGMIDRYIPDAFYSIEDVRQVSERPRAPR